MLALDLTLPTPQENIALDEALLEAAEMDLLTQPVLRLWSPHTPIVVLGRSSKYQQEVNLEFCQSANIPIIRRCSGGATIVTADCCLMYAVLINFDQRHPELRMIDQAHQFVIAKIGEAVAACGVETQLQGTCDLTVGDRKVSGNALRYKKRWMLYHGTLICSGMDLELISNCLGTPARQPEYRRLRTHSQFLTQIDTDVEDLKSALLKTWNANTSLKHWPIELTQQLVTDKYSQDWWNLKI